MKRMLAFVTGQQLPNFIPLNEPGTRPDALHLAYTPAEPMMQQRFEDMVKVLRRALPGLCIEDPVTIADAYDAQAIAATCETLLDGNADDEWFLNATGGTKLMSGPAMDVFFRRGRPVLYVETPRRRTLVVNHDWSVLPIPFSGCIDLSDYFALHGMRAVAQATGTQTQQERTVHAALNRLSWRVWSNVCLWHGQVHLAEYDVVGIEGYQLSVFECKRLQTLKAGLGYDDVSTRGARKRQHSDVREDLFKLHQVRSQFGGPFGRSYWVLSGDFELSKEDEDRIRVFGIRLLRDADIKEIGGSPGQFCLPPVRPKTAR